MKSILDQLETRLQTLLESSMHLLPASLQNQSLAKRLVETIRGTQENSSPNDLLSTGNYTVFLNPEELNFWKTKEDFLAALTNTVQDTLLESEFNLTGTPIITFQKDDNLPKGEFRIAPAEVKAGLGETAAMPAFKPTVSPTQDPRPANAFLIVDPLGTIPLRLTVINLGRRLTNEIVINDPRVSREHAQLRAVRGQYILLDLNSTGGTYINGHRISQQVLKPGDVISLAGVSLVYGEDADAKLSSTNEIISETPSGTE